MREQLENKYFEWLCNLACGKRYSKQISYDKLLEYLHCREFTYLLPMDENRASDGLDMRYKYALSLGYAPLDTSEITNELTSPCSVLEMMLGLACRCEEEIMDNGDKGDRTGQWFWEMIVSLGLGSMTDDRFDKYFLAKTVDRFLNREYEPDGHGGLFTISNCDIDLREVEIWVQLCWHLDSIS